MSTNTAKKQMPSGLVSMSFDEYRAAEGVNKSSLRHMADSPKHYQYRLTNPEDDKPAYVLGRATDCSILEPAKFLDRYIRWDGGRRFGKEWDAFKAEHASQEILTSEEWQRCIDMRAAVRGDKYAAPLLERGIAQPSFFWTDSATGIKCKGRADWVTPGEVIVDLKTCRDGGRFPRDAREFGYDIQAAYYTDGIAEATDGELLPFVFIVVESEPPYDVMVFYATEHMIEVGRSKYKDLLSKLAWHQTTNVWPGRYTEPQDLDIMEDINHV